MPTPEEVLAEFARMQQEKNNPTINLNTEREEDKAVVVNSPNSIFGVVPSINELPKPIIAELPGDKSRGPELIDKVPSTSPITQPTNILTALADKYDVRARVPEGFMNSMSVILKEGGMDSMSQEKALAKINELIN